MGLRTATVIAAVAMGLAGPATGAGHVAPARPAAGRTPAVSEHQAAPRRTRLDSTTVVVPMQLGSGRPVVQVRINGQGPFDFILDTGAGTTVIDSALAADLGLASAGADSVGDPRNPHAVAVERTEADSLQLGGLLAAGVPMVSFDIRRMLGQRYGGVLGLPVFAPVLVTLDYPRGVVRLTRGELPADDPAVVAYESPDGIVNVPIQVSGTTFAAHLDSGNPGGLVLPHAAAANLTFQEAPRVVGQARTVGGTATVHRARLRGEVRIGPLVYNDPEVLLSELLDRWANIGFDMLRELTVTIDQQHHRLRLERTAPAGTALPQRRRVGVMFAVQQAPAGGFALVDGGLPLDNVVPGSIAEQAGLRPGDHLLAVNGRDIAAFAPGDLAERFSSRESLVLRVRRAGGEFEIRIP